MPRTNIPYPLTLTHPNTLLPLSFIYLISLTPPHSLFIPPRIFSQSAGMDSGFGAEDEYSTYSKPLFERAEASSIYRPKKDDSDVYGDVDTQVVPIAVEHIMTHTNILELKQSVHSQFFCPLSCPYFYFYSFVMFLPTLTLIFLLFPSFPPSDGQVVGRDEQVQA